MLSNLAKNKKVQFFFLVTMMLTLSAVGCFANEVPAITDPTVVVIDSFKTIVANIIKILAAIGVAGVSIKAIMMGWTYGNKIFRKVT